MESENTQDLVVGIAELDHDLCMYVCMCVCVCVCVCVHMWCVCVCVCVCGTFMCMCLCTIVCICGHMCIHVSTNRRMKMAESDTVEIHIPFTA